MMVSMSIFILLHYFTLTLSHSSRALNIGPNSMLCVAESVFALSASEFMHKTSAATWEYVRLFVFGDRVLWTSFKQRAIEKNTET